MRKIIVSMFLLLFLVACTQTDESEPDATLVPTADVPRITLTPTPTLPPTWTPEPFVDGRHLPGETAPIAGSTQEPVDLTGRTTYTVQGGDTLGVIAAKFNITVDALADANNITNINVIEVGTVLVIPDN